MGYNVNVSKRRQRLEGRIGTFIRQYARKRHPRHDPNDRRYNREVEAMVKRMDPQELDALLRDEGDSRAELALGELCSRLGYCDALYESSAIFEDPPPDADAFVDAVLRAEGREPDLVLREERRPMLDIVTKWAVYEEHPGDDQLANRPRFPVDH